MWAAASRLEPALGSAPRAGSAERIAGGRVLHLVPERKRVSMIQQFRRRYLDLLGSIYIYNEHRGYTAIDRVLEAIRSRWPDDHRLIAQIEKHRADERKHYLMFKSWFEHHGKMPLAVDSTCGHIDRFVGIMFRSRIDDLDPMAIVRRDELFGRMCRVISLTEKRGHKQVLELLGNGIVRRDRRLVKIFRIIEQDEPSHWAPYDAWLLKQGRRTDSWWERAIDRFIHSELLFLKLPVLFLRPGLHRLSRWPDEGEAGLGDGADTASFTRGPAQLANG
jgi:hypothetical protein